MIGTEAENLHHLIRHEASESDKLYRVFSARRPVVSGHADPSLPASDARPCRSRPSPDRYATQRPPRNERPARRVPIGRCGAAGKVGRCQ